MTNSIKMLREPFCCEEMRYYIKDKVINYNCIKRIYSLPFKQTLGISLDYCPWCGNKLPSNLTEEFYEFLKRDHKIDLAHISEAKRFPEEFQSDIWWIRRGL
jgi:hypothetical protein